jgi:hypothetical protein
MSHPNDLIPDPKTIINQMEVPGNPGIFILGSYENNVSILSQQTRAINLALSLESAGRLKFRNGNYKDIIVLGNGVAGKTAAAMFQRCHCNVKIIAPSDRPNPAKVSARFIHPYISEFPYWSDRNPFRLNQDDADLPVLTWSKGKARKVYDDLESQWRRITNNQPSGAKIEEINGKAVTILWESPANYHVVLENNSLHTAPIIIIAVGLGELPESNYWNNHEILRQTYPPAGKTWVFAGLGDSNITEIITLVAPQIESKPGYEWIIEKLAEKFKRSKPDEQEQCDGLLTIFAEIEKECATLNDLDASNRLKVFYQDILDFKKEEKFSRLENVYQSIKIAIDKRYDTPATRIVIVNPSGKEYASTTFPLNRLAFALILKCINELAENKKIKYEILSGRCAAELLDNKDYHVVKVTGNTLRWIASDYYNLRSRPESPLKSIRLGEDQISSHSREIEARNSLDQTRHRMWPFFGNIKRIISFCSCEDIEFSYSQDTGSSNHGDLISPLIAVFKLKNPTKNGGFVEIEMCYVPGYITGSGRQGKKPNEGFWISRYPITNGQYSEVISGNQNNNDSNNSDIENYPKTNISWLNALQFCKKLGVSLPTSNQWKFSWQHPCENPKRIFPWGNNEKLDRLSNVFNNKRSPEYGARYGICKVNCYEHASGPFGTVQQFGNILEWCIEDDGDDGKTDSGPFKSTPLRPLCGVSSLNLFSKSKSSDWAKPNQSHYATESPDVGFRVVWMGAVYGKTLEKVENNETYIKSDSWRLSKYESWLDGRKKIVEDKICDCRYTFSRLIENIKSISSVEIVLGTYNSSGFQGSKSESALASDAVGLENIVTNINKIRRRSRKNRRVKIKIFLGDQIRDKQSLPPSNTIRIFVGSGRVNTATVRALEWMVSVNALNPITPLDPKLDFIYCANNDVHDDGERSVLSVNKLPHHGPIIFSAGVGRGGTMASNKALGSILSGKRNDLLGANSLLVQSVDKSSDFKIIGKGIGNRYKKYKT